MMAGLAQSISGLIDTDGDGVPDLYDAFPGNPAAAFVQNVPADGPVSDGIAFEDLFGRSQAGDADYNDFIAEYRIQEILDPDEIVRSIRVDANARVKLAGYNHEFGIRIDGFEGSATLTRHFIDANGIERERMLGSAAGAGDRPVRELEERDRKIGLVHARIRRTAANDESARRPLRARAV